MAKKTKKGQAAPMEYEVIRLPRTDTKGQDVEEKAATTTNKDK